MSGSVYIHKPHAHIQVQKKWSRGESNPRPDSQKPHRSGKNESLDEVRGAESGALDADPAHLAPSDTDLARLIEAWPSLPDSIRSEILAMLNAARAEARK